MIKDGDHGHGRRLVIRLREAGAEGQRLAQRAEVGGLGLPRAQERRGGGGGGASLHDLQRDRRARMQGGQSAAVARNRTAHGLGGGRGWALLARDGGDMRYEREKFALDPALRRAGASTSRRPRSMDIIGLKAAADPARARTAVQRESMVRCAG